MKRALLGKINNKIDLYWFWILLILLFHLINNQIILSFDNTPLVDDSSCYFQISSDSHLLVKEEVRPPLFMYLSFLFYHFFGKDPDTAVMSNSVFLFILFFSTYGIGKKIHSRKVGLLAAIILSTYPIIFGHSRVYMPSLPLAAMVALSVLFLLLSNNFSNRRYSLLFGLSIGLGMFIKQTYPVFIIGPLLYCLVYLILKKKNSVGIKGYRKFKVFPFINLFLSLLLGILICSFWYIPNMKAFLHYFMTDKTISLSYRDFINLESIFFYPCILVERQIYWFYFLVLMVSIIYLIRTRTREFIFLLVWVMVPYLFFTFFAVKDARYTIPYLPAISVITSLGLDLIPGKKRGISLIVFVVLIGISQFFFISYFPKAEDIYSSVRMAKSENYMQFGLLQANRTDWKTKEILSVLKEDNPQNKSKIITAIFLRSFIICPLRYQARLEKLPFIFQIPRDMGWETFNYNDYSAHNRLIQAIIDSDYILICDVKEYTHRRKFNEILEQIFFDQKSQFALLAMIKMPDDSYVSTYKKRISIKN